MLFRSEDHGGRVAVGVVPDGAAGDEQEEANHRPSLRALTAAWFNSTLNSDPLLARALSHSDLLSLFRLRFLIRQKCSSCRFRSLSGFLGQEKTSISTFYSVAFLFYFHNWGELGIIG